MLTMNCKIKYNTNGLIEQVLTPSGEDSSLYRQLASMPFNTPEMALEAYKQSVDSTEAYFEVNGEIYNTYKEALKNSNGQDIEVVTLSDDGRTVLQRVTSNTNPATIVGFVNNAIKSDLLSDTKIFEDGVGYYQPEGYDPMRQIVSQESLKDFSAENSINMKLFVDGRMLFEKNDTNKQYADKTYPEVVEELGQDGAVMTLGFSGILNNMFGRSQRVRKDVIKEQALIQNITDLLTQAGFTITTIDNYKKNYKTKNEVEPNAEALIDIANKIVAFSEGGMTADNITEEFLHFLVEVLPQEEIQDALRNVVNTKEYAEFSESYRKVYSKDGSLNEQEVEEQVRKEILGKILSKGVVENLTDNSQNIFNYILDKIRLFLTNLNIIGNEHFKTLTRNLQDRVSDMIVNKDISSLTNLDNLNTKRFIYYSLNTRAATPQIEEVNTQLKIILNTLKDQERILKKNRSSNVRAIEEVVDKIMQVEAKSSLLATIDFVNKQVDYVEKAVSNAKSIGESISAEEAVVLSNLKEHILPAVVTLGKQIQTDSVLNVLNQNLDDIKVRISNLELKPEPQVMDRIIKRTMARHQLPAEFVVNGEKVNTYDYFKNAIDTVSKDTNTIYAYIGQVSHAKEPLLNLLDSVVFDMVQNSHRRFYTASKDFQKSLNDLGLKERDLTTFYDKDGYMLSIWDWSKYREDQLNILTDSFIKHLSEQKASKGDSMNLTREEVYDKLKSGKRFEEGNQLEDAFKDAYSKEVSKSLAQLKERPYTDEDYQRREDELAELGIPQEALNKLRQLGFDRADIMSRVDMSSGYPVLKIQDKIDLDAYNSERSANKGLYDIDGELKRGLIVLSEAQFKNRYSNIYEANKYIYDNGFVKVGGNYINIDNSSPTASSDEAKIAYGISKVDGNFIQNNETVREYGLTDDFLTQLRNIENTQGKEAAHNFFNANVNLALDDSFYQTQKEDEFESYLNSSEVTEEFQNNYEKLNNLQNSRRELLKRYRDSKNATNTLASKMPSEVKERIRNLSGEITEKRKALYREMGTRAEAYQIDPSLESATNEDYKGYLRDSGIENNKRARLAYAMKNTSYEGGLSTPFSALDYIKIGSYPSTFLENVLDKAVAGISLNTDIIFQNIENIKNSDMSLSQKEASIEDVILDIKIQLAEQRLAPYYKALTPVNVSAIFDSMSDYSQGSTSILQSVEDLQNSSMKLGLHESYYGARKETRGVNDNYKKGFVASKEQPRLSKYFNSNFESKLGVKVKRDSSGRAIFDENGIPEVVNSNKMFEAYKLIMEYHRGSLNATNEAGHHNVFMAPQVSRTGLDKIKTAIQDRKQAMPLAKEFVKELTAFRVDEQVQGQTLDNGESMFIKTGLRVVPKRYFQQLESVEDVTDDLFYSLTLMRQEAELHKARKEALTEVTALEEAIANKKFTNGKAAVATSTYKMAKSYIDYNIYGITESVNFKTTLPIIGQVDVAKVAKMFHKYIRLKNLGWNLVIPITSWLTAEANIQLEGWVGQYLDKDSLAEARKLTVKYGAESASEAFNVRTTGHLNMIGQLLGVYDLDRTYENSKFGKLPIMVTRLSMAAHTAANYSPVAQGMLAGLIGQRAFFGKFMDKSQFDVAYRQQNPNTSKKELDNAWTSLKDKSFYSYINTTAEEGKLSFDFDRMAIDLGQTNNEEFKKMIETEITTVSGKVKKFIERIDGNIPQHEKTMLQRNFLGSFLMTHKGWQSIAITNRFKDSHLNLITGQVEEGSYLTLARKTGMVVDGLVKAFSKGDMRGALEVVKKVYTDAKPYEKTNLQRVLKDQVFLMGVYAICMMMAGFADDDDNKDLYFAQMSAYLMERVFNETKSSQFGLLGEISNTVKQPVVGFDNLVKTLDFRKALDFTEVKSGKYAGMTKSASYFIDVVPGFKSTYSILSAENIEQQRRGYEHFNGKDDFNPASLILTSDDFKAFINNNDK